MNGESVRYATEADIAWLASVDTWPRRADWPLKLAGNHVYVIEAGRERAGHARLDVIWSTVPFLAMIFILPEFRGRGLSRTLLRFVEADLAGRGYVGLLSSAQTNEPSAQRWHTVMGFAANGIIEHIADDNAGELVYRKQLTTAA
jgi:ribosomal protein S18 acetylase RimI-like enzyme